MKILVFSANTEHRKSAELLLASEHNLTVVETYDKAQALLVPKPDFDKAKDRFRQNYGDTWFRRYDGVSEEKRKERIAYYDECLELATTHPDFDVVLTDLLVPASQESQGEEGAKFVGQDMPLGTTIALLALCVGIKNVAVVTTINNRHHPASAALDCFRGCKAVGVKILCTNQVHRIRTDLQTGEIVDREFLGTNEGQVKYPKANSWGNHIGVGFGGLDWKEILLRLTDENYKEER